MPFLHMKGGFICETKYCSQNIVAEIRSHDNSSSDSETVLLHSFIPPI